MPSSSSFRARLCLELLAQRCLLSNFGLDSIVQVSQDDPFANSTADDPQHQSGTLYPGTSLETFLVVDPTNPDHLAAMWQQDRWSNGGARGLEVGISFDGGQTWQDEPLPGVGLCAGGTTARASDPWLAFAANGDLYATALTVSAQARPLNVVVCKSTDGGFTWQDPVTIPNSNGADKESIMTDPSDPQTAYVVWTGAYSRTTDGGQTFSPARGFPSNSGSQVVVLPDGTLVDSDGFDVFRSTDHGQTWGPRIRVPDGYSRQVIDPNTRQGTRAGLGLGDLAVDPNNGTLYIVVEDAAFSFGQYDGIGLSQSTDGGLTWSPGVLVNQTPTDIPALDQQAFIPTVQVAADGTVGVSYYDFRNNQGGPDLPTDYWFVPGTPDGSGGITWGNELRLTDQSFNFEDAPFSVYGKMVGDYQGRASAGNDMLNLFGHPDGGSGDVIFFRRVINLGDGPGNHPGKAPGGGRGGLESTAGDLAALLEVDPVGVPFPVTLTPDRPTQQPPPVNVPAWPDLWLGSPEPFATRFTHHSQGVKHVAPAPSSDLTMPAWLIGEEPEASGAKGTSSSPDSL
jgi:hypothetical protein